MASRQQLARVSPEVAAACRDSVLALRKVLAFQLPSSTYFDADWFGVYFLRLIECSPSVSESLVVDFAEALSGDEIVNDEFPEFEVDELPRLLAPSAVRRLSQSLNLIQNSEWRDIGSLELNELNNMLKSDFDEPPGEYFTEMLGRLGKFYADASADGQFVISWWD